MVFVENDSFRNLRRLPTDAFRSIPRLPREDVVLPVAASDLVAWYPFRQGDGSDATAGDSNFGDTTDYSATVNGATYKPNGGTTDIKTGANSGAFDFDGTDDAVNAGTISGAQFTGNDSFTVTVWATPQSQASNFPMIISPEDSDTINDIWSLIQDDDSGNWAGTMNFRISNGGSPTNLRTMNTPLNEYTHFAVGHDSSTGEAFEFSNGIERDRISVNFTPASYPGEWTIGAGSLTGFRWDGFIDDVRIYNRALTPSEISDIYNATEP